MATKKKAKALPTTITLRPEKEEAQAIVDLAKQMNSKWHSTAIMKAVLRYPGDQILKEKYRKDIQDLISDNLQLKEKLREIASLIGQFKRMSTEISEKFPE